MNIKLSQLKKRTIRKLSFVEGEAVSQGLDTVLNGDLIFYELGKEKVEEITKKLDGKEKSDEDVIFELIPLLSDIEVDVTFDEFKAMLVEPSKEFAMFLSNIISMIKDLFELVEEVAKMQNNSQTITNGIAKLSTIETEIEDVVIETKEEKLERLYEELSVAREDVLKRNEILKEIMSLQSEME